MWQTGSSPLICHSKAVSARHMAPGWTGHFPSPLVAKVLHSDFGSSRTVSLTVGRQNELSRALWA